MNINSNTNIKNLYSNNINTGIISNAIVVNGLKFVNNYINKKDNNNNNNSNNNNNNNNNNNYSYNNNNNNNKSDNSIHQSSQLKLNNNTQIQSDNLHTKNNRAMDPHIRATSQVVQSQPPQQKFEEYNQFQPSIQLPSSLPSQGSFTGINPNVPPPLPDVDNGQSNNLILSSLEQQYFSNFLESFLVDNDADLINNNEPLPNPPPFVNNMNDDLKNQMFPIQDSNIFYSMVNDIQTVPPTSNDPNMLSPTKQPSSQPLNVIPPENRIPTPNSILQEKIEVVPKINTQTNTEYINPPNSNDIKDQLTPLSSNPDNMNNPFENHLDHSKYALFSDPVNIPKNQDVAFSTDNNNNTNEILNNPESIDNKTIINADNNTTASAAAANPPTRGRRGRPRLSESRKNNPDDKSNPGAKSTGSKYKRKRKITAMLTPSQQSKLETLNTIYNVNTIGKNKRAGNAAAKAKENEDTMDAQSSSNASSHSVLNDGNSVSNTNVKEENGKDGDSKVETKKPRKQTKELLTEEEKRANHIASEKKRRNLIRLGFQELTDLVPGLKLSSGVGVDGSLMPFNNSKSTILFKAVEYIKQLETRNKELTQELETLRRKIRIDEHIYSVAAVNVAAAVARQQNPTTTPSQTVPGTQSNTNIPNMYSMNNPPASTQPGTNNGANNANYNQFPFNSNNNTVLPSNQLSQPQSHPSSHPEPYYI